MKTIITSLIVLTATLPLLSAAETRDPFLPAKKLTAHLVSSSFPEGHDTYNGMGTGSNGCIYYVLSTEPHDIGGRMFVYDPKTGKAKLVTDLTEACGEKGKNTVVQGKSHVNFVEANGKLYFATHIGYYSNVDGMEKMGIPPAGWKAYPGGHLLAYDMKKGTFEDLAMAPDGEGVITFNMDTKRGRMFAITWPAGQFFRFDMATKNMKNFGKQCREGENGKGAAYSTVCRSIAVDPEDGSAYYSTGDGEIYRYRADTDNIEKIADEDLKKDYFGIYDSTNPGHMGYNWRQTFYRPKDKMIYGVHGNSGYLFRFDPRTKRIEVLDRITSDVSKRRRHVRSVQLRLPWVRPWAGRRHPFTTSRVDRSTKTASASRARTVLPWARRRGSKTFTSSPITSRPVAAKTRARSTIPTANARSTSTRSLSALTAASIRSRAFRTRAAFAPTSST